jgi:hypothetical protein
MAVAYATRARDAWVLQAMAFERAYSDRSCLGKVVRLVVYDLRKIAGPMAMAGATASQTSPNPQLLNPALNIIPAISCNW